MITFPEKSSGNTRFRSRGGALSVIISFLLGFVFAFVAVGGAIFYVVTTIKVKDGVEKIGSLTGTEINYADYVSEDYAQKTLLQLFKEDVKNLVNKAQDKTLCLDDLNAISPQVGKTVSSLLDTLKNDYGIAADGNELLKTPVSDFVTYLTDTLKSVDLGELLASPKINVLTEDSANYDLLMAICYGDESRYDITDGKVVMKEGFTSTKIGDFMDDAIGALGKAPLGTLMALSGESDKITLALAYGKEGKDYVIVGDKIRMLPLPYAMIDGVLYDEEGNKAEYDETIYAPEKQTGEIYFLKNKSGDYLLRSPATIKDLTGDNTAFFDRIRKDITLGDMMTIDENSSEIMKTLKDYSLEDLTKEETITGLKLGEVITIDENDPSTSLILVALKDKTISDLTNQDTIEALELGQVITIDKDSSLILQALQHKTIAELSDQKTINDLKLSQILTIDEKSSLILKALQDKTVADLGDQNTINGLKLGDVMEIDDNSAKIIQAMQNWTIEELAGNKIETDLTLGDILGEDKMTGNILKNLTGSTIGSLSDDINALTVQQVMANDIYVDPDAEQKVLKGTWKYPLTDKDTGKEGQYTLTEMSAMVDNMAHNIQKATLFELHADGIINAEESFLETEIMYEYTVAGTTIFTIDPKYTDNEGNVKTTLGDLTINQMINYISKVIEGLNPKKS